MDQNVTVLSLGAGVQSSALLFAYLNGLLKPMPDFAVFADTQAEPESVYAWLNKLKEVADRKSVASKKIKIIEATRGNIVKDLTEGNKRFATIPFFIKKIDGTKGMGRRQCTREYKIDVVQKAIRTELGYKPKQRMKHKIDMLLGISVDEAQRMKDSRIKWITNKYPLIYDLNWNRDTCIKYLREQGIGDPPKSACYICPYRSDISWKYMKDTEPDAFDKAVSFEKKMQKKAHQNGFVGEVFLHAKRIPLDQVDFDKMEFSTPLFGNDCEGMCGI